MNIFIQVIPNEEQRLGEGQPGDWFFAEEEQDVRVIKGDLIVRVSQLGDWRYETLLGRHEMDEAIYCKHLGIPEPEVAAFDARPEAVTDDPDSFSGYPGGRVQDPHNDALASEWQMSRLLGVNWREYGKAFSKFWNKTHAKITP